MVMVECAVGWWWLIVVVVGGEEIEYAPAGQKERIGIVI